MMIPALQEPELFAELLDFLAEQAGAGHLFCDSRLGWRAVGQAAPDG